MVRDEMRRADVLCGKRESGNSAGGCRRPGLIIVYGGEKSCCGRLCSLAVKYTQLHTSQPVLYSLRQKLR